MKAGENWVGYRKRSSQTMRAKWRNMALPTMAEMNVEHGGGTEVLGV